MLELCILGYNGGGFTVDEWNLQHKGNKKRKFHKDTPFWMLCKVYNFDIIQLNFFHFNNIS